ncbi:MAG: hypothetical protein WCY23_03890 [Candidatus Omnitrophota bacterium]
MANPGSFHHVFLRLAGLMGPDNMKPEKHKKFHGNIRDKPKSICSGFKPKEI